MLAIRWLVIDEVLFLRQLIKVDVHLQGNNYVAAILVPRQES